MTRDRVLIVDDSAMNRIVLRGHLEAEKYEVVEATSGDSALALLAREQVDVAVIDILMPGMDGYETCRRIRANPALAGMPVLFLTALGDREATAPALDAGGDDILSKPFHRAEVILRIAALIRQRRTADELRRQLDEISQRLRD